MKDWTKVPEVRKILDEIYIENPKLEAEQKAKGVRLEFDPVIEKKHHEWSERIKKACYEYKKEHPEEFDENGDFKQDS